METNQTEIYGSFYIENTEFAVNVASIQEVVNLPSHLTCVPLSPPHLVGVFNLRGLIIPIVNLRRLLNFASSETNPSQKVAIVEQEGVRIGLLFDATGEILRVNSEEKSAFEYSNESNHDIIAGAIKLDQGNRLLQIIHPPALVKIHNIPHVLEKQQRQSSVIQEQRGLRKKCISFASGGVPMAIEIGGIHEIVRVPEIQHSALESKLCRGMITLRGQVVPVIDFAQLIGRPPIEGLDPADRRIVVLKIDQEFFGLLVDAVDNISSYHEKDIMPIPLIGKDRAEMFLGCIDFGAQGNVVLLNHKKIFSSEEVKEITHGHAKIYRAQDQESTQRRSVNRQVYISFRLDQLLGVSIQDVKEIINYPDEITSTPGTPNFVKGMLNLRGKLVTIVDARTLYQLPPSSVANPKVLIFQTGDEKFGLVVDTVESILTVHDDQKLPLPKLLYDSGKETYQKDVKEALEVTGDNGERNSLIILNIDPLAERIRQHAA
ncbi:MAG: chemotaxis protein CheW [Bdellovibrionales bacterium]|nr:chemotaxis protein CheW [Bdellovibrionales bacterium]